MVITARVFIISVIVLCFAAIFSKSNFANTFENNIGYSQIHPAHPLYFLKPVREGFEMHFAQTPNVKFLRQLEFATRRLREVNSLVLTDRQELIEPNMERYWIYIVNLVDKNPDKDATRQITENVTVHIQNLNKIYPEISNLRAKMAIRSILQRLINKLNIPDYAKIPVCQLFSQEASSKALTEVEQIILEERALSCFGLWKKY